MCQGIGTRNMLLPPLPVLCGQCLEGQCNVSARAIGWSSDFLHGVPGALQHALLYLIVSLFVLEIYSAMCKVVVVVPVFIQQ